MKLTEAQKEAILSQVENLFESTKANLLGRYFKGARLFFQVAEKADPMHTIEGIYFYTMNMLYGVGSQPNKKIIENLCEITGNYLDSQKLKTKNHILADLQNAKNQTEAMAAVSRHMDKAGKYIDMLIANETRVAQAYASREGIAKLASDIGVEDPTVVFLGVTDHKICKHCKSMYHDVANIRLPKPYKLSQIREGYFRPKEWDGKSPHQAPLHPRCRHSMSFVPPNFGFTAGGVIEFKSIGYDYYKDYWGLRKSEEPTSTPMADFSGYQEYLDYNLDHHHGDKKSE